MQEEIYAEMNRRNATMAPRIYDAAIEPTRTCIAAWTGDYWHLTPAYRRLMNRLKEIAGPYFTFFWPERAAGPDDGILHQTLLQIVGFDTFDELRADTVPTIMVATSVMLRAQARPLNVEYRGLVWTPTGLAIAGYTPDFERLCDLRDRLASLHGAAVPYKNDIVHATVARWRAAPPPEIHARLRDEIPLWSEAVFGRIAIRSWTVGACTLLMRPVDRYDRNTIRCAQHVAHRGNTATDPTVENNPKSLSTLVAAGHYVELDVWLSTNSSESQLFIGHDGPVHQVSWDWLTDVAPRALIHCKDGATFVGLRRWFAERGLAADLFYHTTEDYALSSGGRIIVYPGQPLFPECLSMMPESVGRRPLAEPCAEICSNKFPGLL